MSHPRVISFLAFFLSLVSLRLLIVRHFEVDWARAYQQGFVSGLILDLSIALLPFAFSKLVATASQRFQKISFFIPAALIYIATLSNACYILFFRKPLDLSMIQYGTGNLWDVRGMIVHFLGYFWIDLSFVLFVISIAFKNSRPKPSLALSSALSCLAMLVGFQLIKQTPIWFRIPHMSESPLSQAILIRWWERWHSQSKQTRSTAEVFSLAKAAPAWFERMRAYNGKTFPQAPNSPSPFPYPLTPAGAEKLSALRTELGLPKTGKVNVVLVFLESNRAYEFLSPQFSDAVYPNLKRIFKEHGIFFNQTYSSADYTVQGQFATLCSTWDRMEGAPVYTSSAFLKIRCLPELLTENGYQTVWMNPYSKNFSGKLSFESNHGMQTFLDGTFFKPRSKQEEINRTEWGVSDHVFFNQALDQIESLAQEKTPFFVHLLNTGTHGPWHRFPEAILPRETIEAISGHSDHHDYLAAIKMEDAALGDFFDRFFKSPAAENTLVVVSSDHGNGVVPGGPKLRKYQRSLLWPRTIFGIVTKNLNPKVISHPAHQIDIAPLIASITGIQGNVTWLGRNPLKHPGTPWVKQTNQMVSYRIHDRICIETSKKSARCWKVKLEEDPLLLSDLKEEENDLSVANDLKEVIQANEAWLDAGGT